MDPKGNWWLAVGAVVVLVVAGGIIYSSKKGSGRVGPTPSPAFVQQLLVDQQPQIRLSFSSDGHEVTVDITNLHASKLEYNLVYDASVRKGREVTQIQTGVTGGGDVEGRDSYSETQLLGSESSGKRVYHEDIHNANMEITLRDASGRSIFTATYPFEVKPGSSATLVASD